MITPEHLRIGNQVYGAMQRLVVRRIDSNFIYLDHVAGGSLAQARPEELEGIPLTQSLLVKSGFVGLHKGDKFFLHLPLSDFTSPVLFGSGIGEQGLSVQLQVNGTHVGVPIYFLHDLQNLFFALTEKELSVQE